MGRHGAWVIAIAAAWAALSGCASTPRIPREALAARIGEDAAAFNDAYSRAVNGQILLNILRSRDRQPRYYLSMTGIQDAPSFLYGDSVGLGGVSAGEQRGQPWGVLSFSARREVTSRPSYAVQPLDAKTLTRAVFQPTAPNVFSHYWESGWPRDMLLLLMVEKITVRRGGTIEEFTNEANDIRDDCAPGIVSRGCAFVDTARAFLAEIGKRKPASPSRAADARAICGLIEAYEPDEPVRDAPPKREDEACEPAFVVAGAVYQFDLRSFDDMVYYVGELMRAPYTESQGKPMAPMEARVKVSVAGLRGGGAGAPLFRIIPKSAAKGPFTASVTYDGDTYVSGPPIGRSCADPAPDGLCVDDAAHGDRSSSVLSLLAELLALNQSPDAIRAPARFIAE
ncbi:MAG TPA: hypothetical protein VG983_00655 [Caulobacterales bacterium]|nr:hypothetical protein [Caulobacterales bacterium]